MGGELFEDVLQFCISLYHWNVITFIYVGLMITITYNRLSGPLKCEYFFVNTIFDCPQRNNAI